MTVIIYKLKYIIFVRTVNENWSSIFTIFVSKNRYSELNLLSLLCKEVGCLCLLFQIVVVLFTIHFLLSNAIKVGSVGEIEEPRLTCSPEA